MARSFFLSDLRDSVNAFVSVLKERSSSIVTPKYEIFATIGMPQV